MARRISQQTTVVVSNSNNGCLWGIAFILAIAAAGIAIPVGCCGGCASGLYEINRHSTGASLQDTPQAQPLPKSYTARSETTKRDTRREKK